MVSFGDSTTFYALENFPVFGTNYTYSIRPGTDDIIASHKSSSSSGYVTFIHRDIADHLQPLIDGQYKFTISYALEGAPVASVELKDEYGVRMPMSRPIMSENGRYLSMSIVDRGAGFVDLETGKLRVVSRTRHTWEGYNSMPVFDVTNDGKTFVEMNIAHQVSTLKVRDVSSDSCGYDGIPSAPSSVVECTHVELFDVLKEAYGNEIAKTLEPSEIGFHGNNELRITYGYVPSRPGFERTVSLINTNVEVGAKPTLEYLALGDSYSSGEGDIERLADGSSYYLPSPEYDDDCHISKRSCPYLLRDKWGISGSQMKTIACSGAQVVSDYTSRIESYNGQGTRLLGLGIAGDALLERKNHSIDSFIAGEVPQLEFVKRYKPGVITLTGGGNDIGFAEIINYCATPHFVDLISRSCEYVYKDSELHRLLYDAIDSQALYNRRLLEMIKAQSPQSRVVVVGYPSFIAGGWSTCALNSAVLDFRERDMINEAVTALNTVLKREAARAGVEFVDIENVLSGGRICEGSEYVTGLFDAHGYLNEGNRVSSFHPNAAAHRLIATRIDTAMKDGRTGNLNNQDTGDQVASPARLTVARSLLPSDTISRGKSSRVKVQIGAYELAANILVSLKLYSDPIGLGSYMTSDDGSLDVSIYTRRLPVGKHVLRLDAQTYDGQPVTYYQFVTVYGEKGDIDGDGVPDQDDKCNFIEEWYDEKTGKNVCVSESSIGTTKAMDKPSPTSSQGATGSSASRLVTKTDSQTAENSIETADSSVLGANEAVLSEKPETLRKSTNTYIVTLAFMALTTLGVGVAYGIKKHCKKQ